MKPVGYMPIRIKLKERISQREFERGETITLKDVAEATGIHRVTLSKISGPKHSNVGTDILDKLCGYFECELGEIAEYVPERPKVPEGQNG